MEKGRSLFFKVRGQGHWAFKEFLHLDPCRQAEVRTMWARLLKLSKLSTNHLERGKDFLFSRSDIKVTWQLNMCNIYSYFDIGFFHFR